MYTVTQVIGIISNIAVLGTLLLGYINFFALKKSERQSREYNLKMADYEKRRDFLLVHISEYISLLNVHKLSYMALSDEEYEGKDIEIYNHYYNIETCFYKIKLFLNSDNLHYEELSNILDLSLETADKIRTDNSMAEMISCGLRKPEEYAEACANALSGLDSSYTEQNTLNFVKEAMEIRDKHLKKYLLAVEESMKHKKEIADITRKYIAYEKKLVIGDKTL